MTVAGRRAIIGALMVAAGAFACTGGGSSFGTSFGGGSSGSGGVGGVGSEPLPPVPSNPGSSSPPEPSEIPVPFVECIAAPVDAGEDAGDASDGDAGASPCEAPPQPSCLSKTSMVEWSAGPCVDYACAFVAEVIACPGGCFRQLDGGEHCNRK